MKPVTLYYTLLVYIYVVNAQEACKTLTKLDGQCKNVLDCEKLKPLIKQSTEDREYLKTFFCGFDDKDYKVCCPNRIPDKECTTVSGKFGSCVPLKSCPSIEKRLTKPVSDENMEYVHRSRCGEPKDFNVCCDPSETINKVGDDKEKTCDPSALFPDRSEKCCGIDSSSGNKIIGGTNAAIDAYPWLAIIEYPTREILKRPLLCGGSLISSRYVLTAAHCLITVTKAPLGAESVRLGEYNVTNKGPDCVETDGGGLDCTKGDISIKIESTIIHPKYASKGSQFNANDIALIRLIEIAPYHEFIRPICLPETDITASPPLDLKFVISGWGFIDQNRKSDVKLEAVVPFVGKEICNQRYLTTLDSSQICAGGGITDSCEGDSGGPLSYSQEDVQEIVGVISNGPKQCGTINNPSIYIKVYDYLPWIRSNIKP